jgi:hypothetical protein
MKQTNTRLLVIQQKIRAKDEEIAMRCDPPVSKSTVRTALRGKGKPETEIAVRVAMESIRQDLIRELTKLPSLVG